MAGQHALHPERLTWNLEMDLWMTRFLYNNKVVLGLRVSLPECRFHMMLHRSSGAAPMASFPKIHDASPCRESCLAPRGKTHQRMDGDGRGMLLYVCIHSLFRGNNSLTRPPKTPGEVPLDEEGLTQHPSLACVQPSVLDEGA